jgi:protein-S-isoprenylcysteine O-methyltransferase Ste14
MEYLLDLNLQTYTRFLYFWGALGILAPLGIMVSRQLPISNRYEKNPLARFGSIDKKLGWIIMETPILITVSYFYLVGRNPINVSVVIVGAFVFHYIHRALIFPHRIKVEGKRMPVGIVLATMAFYTVNGYLIGHYYGSLRDYPIEWLLDPRFVLGMALFAAGFVINVTSDNILINLRGPGESGYKIPRGGLFEYVSCPNFFGEIVEWIGFALMSWSLPGVVYAAWVSLTLFSTGLRTHRWYIERFGASYPRDRKAVFPRLI